MATRTTPRVIKSPETGALYRLGELLGKGGFGSVWRCTGTGLTGPLCLKLTRDQESWHREAYMAHLLGDHPRVVKIHETFPLFAGGQVAYAVVMELAEGGTVADLVQRDGPWPEARAVAEVAKLLGAIDKLHGCGALHRDITPFNVFACGDPTLLKLGDFGLTTHGPRQGVAADAFPPWFVDRAIREEQRARWDVREDLWQVAQVLVVLLTGKVEPIRAADIRTLRCSATTRAALARAIGARTNRFDSAKTMADALKARARAAAPARPSRPRTPRHPPRTGREARPQGRRQRLDQLQRPHRPAGRRYLAAVERRRRGRPQAAHRRGQARERSTRRPHHRAMVPAPRRPGLNPSIFTARCPTTT
jgi:serine/threonine protein kinase